MRCTPAHYMLLSTLFAIRCEREISKFMQINSIYLVCCCNQLLNLTKIVYILLQVLNSFFVPFALCSFAYERKVP